MKFRYASDLHLEFAYGDPSFLKPKDSDAVKAKAFSDYCDKLFPPHEDDATTVLLLSGDICDNWRAHTRFRGFWQRASERFAEIIWIPGNHEYYGHKLSEYHDTRIAVTMANEFNNVFYWNRNKTSYTCGETKVHVIAATMWTDCDGGNPLTAFAVANQLNDYNHITFADVERDLYRKLRVPDVIAEHVRSRDYIIQKTKAFKDQDPNCIVIVMTHHAPSWQSIPDHFKGDVLSHAYAATIPWREFGEHLPNIWIHGHIHDTVDYRIDAMRVISNPYGYPSHYHNEDYNPAATIQTEELI